MSVLFCHNNQIYFLDHGQIITEMFQNVRSSNERSTENLRNYKLTEKLFSIKHAKKEQETRKRSYNIKLITEVIMLKEIYKNFFKVFPTHLKKQIKNKYDLLNTGAVRDLAKVLFEATLFDHKELSGGNSSNNALTCSVRGEEFLIPRKSRFYCGCVKESCEKLKSNKFDILIADPPWWNKYIRRLKNANHKLGYSMMYNEDIASIPVKETLSPNCLVAVWCTNAQSNITAVKDVIFPKWGVEYLTTWFWLKLTVDLETVCPFSGGSGKQPYERVIIGRIGDVDDVPEDLVFASIPSALHSHKPPLLDLLTPYIQVEEPKILELFARYLLPNTTSVGFEALKWQHISLYEQT